ncbi:pseudouridine synthase [Pedobacter foliorum]|uniref:pseudouridine synthase n=1 Tax=Pedobacter foliorum TaxID=2739058 RepID=UPI001567A6E8|nr:pseudouridine synthase [Pedobacter foliorum]NRF38941.1 pseudouridine synthase [Pedobacter foliorum]
MIKNNNRNSRDDKSKPGNRSTTGKRPSGTESSYKGKSKFDDREGKDNKFGASKDFKPRAAREGDSNREYKPREGDRKDFKPREGDRKDFKPRGSRDGDSRGFKPRTENDSKDFKSRGPRSSGGDFKPRTGRDGDSKGFAPRGAAGKDFKPRTPRDGDSRDYKPRAYKEGSSRETPPGEKTRSYIKKDNFSTGGDKPFRKFDDKKSQTSRSTDSRPFRKRDGESPKSDFQARPDRGERGARPERFDKETVMRSRKSPVIKDDGLIRLNRYIANSGICSRRKADELIAAGVVSVNGMVVSELGQKVDPSKDEIRYNGELLKREKKVYVLLNKPKDYITTTDDPQERRTVMQLVEKASRERIYPVGRLDRNTTGLLLMTNDGDLADKLSHPKNGITKIYHVELSRSLSQGDLNKIQFGLELEDGIIKPDSVSYVTGGSKREVGIQIHSGKNRIVRRIFEHLGYDVVKLDRVVYGNLTKKDLPRGRWRFLEEHELIQIKHLIK